MAGESRGTLCPRYRSDPPPGGRGGGGGVPAY